MSGLAGLLLFDPGLDGLSLVRKMASAMAHRGPDGAQILTSGRLTLAHLMLRRNATTAAQVQVADAGGLTLIMDGRLDNREALWGRWHDVDPARPATDADCLLAAYRQWGDECPCYLEGDFAFAIWDAKQGSLFCARDPMGASPLAWVLNRRLFAFASESEALLGLPGVSPEPNEDLIAHLLVPEFADRGDRRTWQRDVLALAPGESLRVGSDGRPRTRRYYVLQPRTLRRYRSDAECAEHFLEVFGMAVRRRLRDAEPPALMMSGGLDSAAILAMMRHLPREAPAGVHTYSMVGDPPQTDRESQAILTLSRQPGVIPHLVSVPSLQGIVGFDDLYDIAWTRAHPVANAILLPALMCRAASRNRVRALLLGACGDLTLAAPRYYPAVLLREYALREAWRECRMAKRNHVQLQGHAPFTILLRSAYGAWMPGALRSGLGRLRRRLRPFDPGSSLIHPEFAARIRLAERIEQQFRSRDRTCGDGTGQLELEDLQVDMASALSGAGMVAAHQGVESRDPWADRDLVEFFVRLPVRHKVRNGWTKYLVRSALESDLPEDVRERRDKDHLGWRVTRALMQRSGALIAYLFEVELSTIADYVSTPEALAVYRKSRTNPETADWDRLYELAVLILWLMRVKGR